MIKVLLIDDDPDMLAYYKAELKNFSIDSAMNAEEAQSLILKNNEDTLFP
jgi:DNA-binding response OmpR family regulator